MPPGIEPGQMVFSSFGKEDRIRRPTEFRGIIREGTRYQSRHFRVYRSPNGLSHARLGIAVGKHVGSAVQRNRVKRLIREFFRLSKKGLPSSCDFVIVAREGAARLDLRQVCEELQIIFNDPSFGQI
jgi:ribonuclease P protein component